MSKKLIPVNKVWTRQGYTWPGSDNNVFFVKEKPCCPTNTKRTPTPRTSQQQKNASLEEVLGLPHCPHKAVRRGSRVWTGKCCALEDLEMIFGSEKRLGGLGWDLVEASCWSGLPLPPPTPHKTSKRSPQPSPSFESVLSSLFSNHSVGWGP